jgi:hypothetical protein
MIGGCARRSTPGFLFLGPIFQSKTGFSSLRLEVKPLKDRAGRLDWAIQSNKSRQTSSRDPGAFRWNRKNTFIDN